MTPKDIKDAVEAGIESKLGDFFIDRETHYQDHMFLKDLREWFNDIKSTVIKTVIRMIIFCGLGLMIAGFAVWKIK